MVKSIEQIVLDCARQRILESNASCIIDYVDINLDTDLLSDLAFDSLDFVEMSLDLENRLADKFIILNDEDLVKSGNISNITKLIQKKLEA